MANPETLCERCERPIKKNDAAAQVALIYRHQPAGWYCSVECRAEAVGQAVRQPICRHCRQRFEPPGEAAGGRRREYCSSACRKRSARNRSQLWHRAAKDYTPSSAQEAHDMVNGITQLLIDISANRTVDPVPPGAIALLRRYGRKLVGDKARIEQDAVARRRAARHASWVKAEQKRIKAERKHLDDFLAKAGDGE